MLHEFLLVVVLPGKLDDPRIHFDSLREAGCDDAEFCWGIRGHLGVEFRRDANSLSEAKAHALKQVKHAIPGVKLLLYDN